MKQITINGRSILLVEVPEGANGFVLVKSTRYNPPFLYIQSLSMTIDLFPGWWEFLFKDQFYPTEEEAAGVVREYGNEKRYANYCGDYPVWFHYARQSWESLVTAHGFTPGKVVGLIEKSKI